MPTWATSISLKSCIYKSFQSALVVAVINIQIPTLLGDLINTISKISSSQPVSNFVKEMKMPTFKLIYLYCTQSVFTFLYISLLACVGERLSSRIRQHLFASIIKQDIAFFDTHKTGELVNRLIMV